MTTIRTHRSDLGLCSCVCSRNHIWLQDTGTTYLRKGARVGHVATQGSPWPQASGSSLCETYTPFCHIPQSGDSTGLFCSVLWTGSGNILNVQRSPVCTSPHSPSMIRNRNVTSLNRDKLCAQQMFLDLYQA